MLTGTSLFSWNLHENQLQESFLEQAGKSQICKLFENDSDKVRGKSERPYSKKRFDPQTFKNCPCFQIWDRGLVKLSGAKVLHFWTSIRGLSHICFWEKESPANCPPETIPNFQIASFWSKECLGTINSPEFTIIRGLQNKTLFQRNPGRFREISWQLCWKVIFLIKNNFSYQLSHPSLLRKIIPENCFSKNSFQLSNPSLLKKNSFIENNFLII